MKEFGEPVLQKYARIDREGTKKLDGGVKEFRGFGEELKNRFAVAFQFSTESQQSVEERIFHELKAIEDELGVTFAMAGRDYPLHSTIEEGLDEDTDETRRADIFSEIKNDAQFKRLAAAQGDMPITYTYLLVDAGNVLLTAATIPQGIDDFRRELAAIYTAHGLKALPMDHILHITAARISALPENDRQNRMGVYRHRLRELRKSLVAQPMTLQTSGIVSEPTLQFLTRKI